MEFYYSLEIDLYCDDKPHLSAIKSLPPVGDFPRQLGAEVDLKCAQGYLPASSEGVKAKCVADTDKAGKWLSQGECLCFEPESIFMRI